MKSGLYWDKQTILSRIADPLTKVRYEAGSPNVDETEIYRKCIGNIGSFSPSSVTVLVLGMTPEIRSMALKAGFNLISIDKSKEAVETYRGWVPSALSGREKIINAEWSEAKHHVNCSIYAIMGDGIFGNILSLEKHIELLEVLKRLLSKDSVMVFRKILVPEDIEEKAYDARSLISKYRSGGLTDNEFGFSMRLWGNYTNSYNTRTYLLDNSITFKLYKEWVKKNILSESEYSCIARFYFDGFNLIPPAQKWEEMLRSAGLKFECHRLKGKDWYSYYPIYKAYR